MLNFFSIYMYTILCVSLFLHVVVVVGVNLNNVDD